MRAAPDHGAGCWRWATPAGRPDSSTPKSRRMAGSLVPPDLDLVFGLDNGSKWQQAIAKIGIDLSLLSSEVGHA